MILSRNFLNLKVTNKTNLLGALDVVGKITSNDTVEAKQSLFASSTTGNGLIVTNDAKIGNDLYVLNDLSVTNKVTADSADLNNVTINDKVTVTNKLTISQANQTGLRVEGKSSLAQEVTCWETLLVEGESTLQGLTVHNHLTSEHQATLKDTVSLTKLSGTALDVTADVKIGGNLSLESDLKGPAVFNIDPSGHGDETGKVVIRGDLQVDGKTTTVNSETLEVKDKNITVARDATDKATSDGAGITVYHGSSVTASTFNYESSGDNFRASKRIRTAGPLHADDLANKAYVDSKVKGSFRSEVINSVTDFSSDSDYDVDANSGMLLYVFNTANASTSCTVKNLSGTETLVVYPGMNLFVWNKSAWVANM